MKLTRLLLIAFLPTLALTAADHGPSVSPGKALARLVEGNSRFAHGKSTSPNSDAARRADVAKKQHPFAAILGCADSRVPPELVFDQGLGDLFVVRTAGNVPSDFDIASLEYTVKHLGSTLIVVLGHQRCGAVDAAVQDVQETGHLPKILKALEQSVEKSRNMKGNHLDNAIRRNIQDVVEKLQDEEALEPFVKAGKLKIVGAYYNMETGLVTLLDTPAER